MKIRPEELMIEDNVPVPPSGTSSHTRKSLTLTSVAKTMKHGESVFFEDYRAGASFLSTAKNAVRRGRIPKSADFISRKIGQGMRVWRCDRNKPLLTLSN